MVGFYLCVYCFFFPNANLFLVDLDIFIFLGCFSSVGSITSVELLFSFFFFKFCILSLFLNSMLSTIYTFSLTLIKVKLFVYISLNTFLCNLLIEPFIYDYNKLYKLSYTNVIVFFVNF